jgi:hypothetical protein
VTAARKAQLRAENAVLADQLRLCRADQWFDDRAALAAAARARKAAALEQLRLDQSEAASRLRREQIERTGMTGGRPIKPKKEVDCGEKRIAASQTGRRDLAQSNKGTHGGPAPLGSDRDRDGTGIPNPAPRPGTETAPAGYQISEIS